MSEIAVAVIVLALALLAGAFWLRGRTGLPWAPLIADDTAAGRTLDRPLYSKRYGLTGKPDYLIARRGAWIPVEVKPGRQADQPYESDLLQLAAYCLLVEEHTNNPPPYGILRYAEHSFRLNYTDALRDEVIAILDEMRGLLDAEDAARSHDERRRCAGCGFATQCDESLV
ncbi:MAG: CRISPR-associated protein Cas4 [Oscillochloris sp.]|nr:CRISPR-associated protein Cas4 [Oscillochloris sp.]